jgi:hypothetical protein
MRILHSSGPFQIGFLILLGFIIKRSDISQYSISAIPVGINYVCLAEYMSDVLGSFSRETRINVVKTTLGKASAKMPFPSLG